MQGSVEDAAKEKCAQLGWLPTGVEWETLDSSVYYMCVQHTGLDPGNATSLDLSDTLVLRRLVVLSDVDGCPESMQPLVNSAPGLFVCAEFVSAEYAFTSQQYVTDV